MEDKFLKLAGLALVAFIAMAVVFQIAEQLGTFARGMIISQFQSISVKFSQNLCTMQRMSCRVARVSAQPRRMPKSVTKPGSKIMAAAALPSS